MSSIIPEDIMTAEEAKKWLMKRGYGEQLAEEEIANWKAPIIIEDIEEEVEAEIEEEIKAEELTWDDEDEDDDEEWDDEDDDDEDEEDK
tara:strand:+ start:1090 stop:1356 length:267 start_codon:yes stop_codon:yes gene_type:complete